MVRRAGSVPEVAEALASNGVAAAALDLYALLLEKVQEQKKHSTDAILVTWPALSRRPPSYPSNNGLAGTGGAQASRGSKQAEVANVRVSGLRGCITEMERISRRHLPSVLREIAPTLSMEETAAAMRSAGSIWMQRCSAWWLSCGCAAPVDADQRFKADLSSESHTDGQSPSDGLKLETEIPAVVAWCGLQASATLACARAMLHISTAPTSTAKAEPEQAQEKVSLQ